VSLDAAGTERVNDSTGVRNRVRHRCGAADVEAESLSSKSRGGWSRSTGAPAFFACNGPAPRSTSAFQQVVVHGVAPALTTSRSRRSKVLSCSGRDGRLLAQIPGWRVSSLGRQGCHHDADPARGSASLRCSAASASSFPWGLATRWPGGSVGRVAQEGRQVHPLWDVGKVSDRPVILKFDASQAVRCSVVEASEATQRSAQPTAVGQRRARGTHRAPRPRWRGPQRRPRLAVRGARAWCPDRRQRRQVCTHQAPRAAAGGAFRAGGAPCGSGHASVSESADVRRG